MVRCLSFVLFLCALAPNFAVTQEAPAPDVRAVRAEKPLPDFATLIARVRANQTAVEGLRKSYICHVTQVADEFASDGSKKTHTDEYQSFFVEGMEIYQHLARDGKPLSDSDTKKEQERVDKQVAAIKAHEVKTSKEQVVLSPSGLMKVATFSNPRRILLNGRSTVVFDYKGDPKAKTHGLGDEVMRDLSGSLWIDEDDSAIVRMNGSLQENFHVAGGLLVNIKKGSAFDITQAPVSGGLWFMKDMSAHVDGRFLIFKGFSGEAHMAYTDYRRMKTTITLTPGTQVIGDDGKPIPNPEANPEQTTSTPPKP